MKPSKTENWLSAIENWFAKKPALTFLNVASMFIDGMNCCYLNVSALECSWCCGGTEDCDESELDSNCSIRL